jgi:hypothetical protein
MLDSYQERWKCYWAASISSRYHARRQAFFERWHRLTNAICGILGTTAATNAIASGGVGITATAGLVVAALSAIDLVVGTSQMARMHHQLRKRFLNLEAQIQASPEEPSLTQINKWKRKRLKIECDEPPLFNALNLLCENEMRRAHGYSAPVNLSHWHRLTAHWLHWYDLAPDIAPTLDSPAHEQDP